MAPAAPRDEEDEMGDRLAGKVALATGAAKGIGRAVVHRFAQEGAILWINDVDADGLEAVMRELRDAGTTVDGAAGDASDAELVGAWVDAALDRHGRVDVLSNNVGVSRPGLVGDLSDDDWRFQQRMTLDTVFYATRAVLGPMVRQGSGTIVSMSSGAGIGGQYALGGYGAAKAGVINLMETVALEYGPRGIRANAVTPGPTATEPLLAYLERQPGGVEQHVEGLDLRRLSRPEEVANTVLWLASDESSNVTGICVRSNIRSASTRPV
jgi:NAD(P)-dependent dehydrogenase (short-subunit alcohol dehydrogenase family)